MRCLGASYFRFTVFGSNEWWRSIGKGKAARQTLLTPVLHARFAQESSKVLPLPLTIYNHLQPLTIKKTLCFFDNFSIAKANPPFIDDKYDDVPLRMVDIPTRKKTKFKLPAFHPAQVSLCRGLLPLQRQLPPVPQRPPVPGGAGAAPAAAWLLDAQQGGVGRLQLPGAAVLLGPSTGDFHFF